MADQTVTQEQTVRLAPFQEEFLADIFASAEGLTGAGSMMPYLLNRISRFISRTTTSNIKCNEWYWRLSTLSATRC